MSRRAPERPLAIPVMSKYKQIEQKEGMRTKVWGPPAWIFLHTVAHNYPLKPTRQDRKNYKNFFKSIGYILPCKYCRMSYQQYYKELPITRFLNCRENVAYWIFLIHNKVNAKLGRCQLSLKDFKNKIKPRYDSYRAKCKPTTPEEIKAAKRIKGCVLAASKKTKPLKCKISFEVDKKAARAAGFSTRSKKI